MSSDIPYFPPPIPPALPIARTCSPASASTVSACRHMRPSGSSPSAASRTCPTTSASRPSPCSTCPHRPANQRGRLRRQRGGGQREGRGANGEGRDSAERRRGECVRYAAHRVCRLVLMEAMGQRLHAGPAEYDFASGPNCCAVPHRWGDERKGWASPKLRLAKGCKWGCCTVAPADSLRVCSGGRSPGAPAAPPAADGDNVGLCGFPEGHSEMCHNRTSNIRGNLCTGGLADWSRRAVKG